MRAASGKTARSASRKVSPQPALAYNHGRHPKRELYAEIYDPVTQAWFAALDRSYGRVEALLADGRRRGLLLTLVDFNALCHALVDEVLAPGPATDKMVGVVRELRHSVLWVEHAPPEEDAATEDVLSSLQNKIKRNISLGVVEALICLQSAYGYGRERLHLSGAELEHMLRRSRQLYASLAVLHDDQERERLHFLAGFDSHLKYPATDYHHVITGTVTIGADKFVAVGGPDEPRLRFVSEPPSPSTPDSPLLRCPAQRLQTSTDPQRPLNDVLWDLLIDIYRSCDRFS